MKLWSQFKFIPLCTCYLFDARKTWEHTDSEVREFDILLTSWTCCCVCDEPMRWGVLLTLWGHQSRTPQVCSHLFLHSLILCSEADGRKREQKQIQPKILTSAESFHVSSWRDVEEELLMLRLSDSWINRSPGSSDASGTHRTWCLQFCFF